jgi:predicted TIM-barrel fold metal-dependent hydrolase
MIDFHLHLFTRTYFEALASLSTQPGSVEQRLQRVVEKVGLELPDSELGAHTARWLAEFDRHGVERAAAFASTPEEIPLMRELHSQSKGRLVPFAVLNPRAPEAADKLEALLGPGKFAGVLLFPAMHHYRVASSEAAAVFSVLNRHRGVAFVHCGALVVKLRDLLGLPRPMDLSFANPLDLIPAANAHPEVAFVIPHFGAGFLRETLIAGSQCGNIFVDTSSSNSWIRTDPAIAHLQTVFLRTLAVFGPRRILFGTDSNTFPKGWQVARYEEQRAILEELGLSASDRQAIFHDNAAQLLARVG